MDSKAITLRRVVTEHDLVQRSHDLEDSLSKQQFVEFCENKSQESSSERDKNLWNFMKVNLLASTRVIVTCMCVSDRR